MANAIASTSRPFILLSTRKLFLIPSSLRRSSARCSFTASYISIVERSSVASAQAVFRNDGKLVGFSREPRLGASDLFGCRRFSTGAANVNDPGSIDSPLMQSMQEKIKEQLNAESVIVKDAYGDGRHVSIDVVSSSFEGQSAVSRQRMVYKAIWEELQSTVHAVDQMTTRTPSEAATQ